MIGTDAGAAPAATSPPPPPPTDAEMEAAYLQGALTTIERHNPAKSSEAVRGIGK